MNPRTLAALGAVAVAALLVAVLLHHEQAPLSESSEQPRYLLPDLREHVNDVSQVKLSGADNQVLVTLKRVDGGWNVAEKSAYPADVAKVRELLLKLADATLVEQKTSNKDRYADLGVTDIADKAAKGVLVDLAGLAHPAQLIIGNYNGGGGGGTFVRLPDQAPSWLVKGNITVDKSAATWLRHDLTDLPATRFREVVLTAPDGKVLKASKSATTDANYKLADIPKGREPSSEFVANGLAATLAGLRFDDVVPAATAAPADKVYHAHYLAFDGLTVDIQAWEKDGKDYAQFKAGVDAVAADAQIHLDQAIAKTQFEAKQFDASQPASASTPAGAEGKPETAKAADGAPAPAAAAPAVAPESVSNPAHDREQRLAALAKEAEDLNKTFEGWSFVLPNYKFSNLNKGMEEMLKPLDAPKPGAAPAIGKRPNSMVGPGSTLPGSSVPTAPPTGAPRH